MKYAFRLVRETGCNLTTTYPLRIYSTLHDLDGLNPLSLLSLGFGKSLK